MLLRSTVVVTRTETFQKEDNEQYKKHTRKQHKCSNNRTEIIYRIELGEEIGGEMGWGGGGGGGLKYIFTGKFFIIDYAFVQTYKWMMVCFQKNTFFY